MKLSTVTITKNEAANIRRCLESVRFADENVVVDSGSTDETVKIASGLGARMIHHEWKGYGPQKNVGLSRAEGEWVLFIDADEEVTAGLAREIGVAVNSSATEFYWLRVVTVFLGKPLRHLFGHNPRLFRKAAGCWNNAFVHEQVETLAGEAVKLGDQRSLILKNPLLHHSHASIRSYLESMHRYTTLDAEEMAKTRKHRSGRSVVNSRWLPAWLASRQFIKLLFYRRGILDGWQGWVWCALSAYYEWEMAIKFRALSKS